MQGVALVYVSILVVRGGRIVSAEKGKRPQDGSSDPALEFSRSPRIRGSRRIYMKRETFHKPLLDHEYFISQRPLPSDLAFPRYAGGQCLFSLPP